LIAAAFAVGHYTRKLPDARAIRFSFAPPFKTASLNVAASPDGTHIAFTGIYGDMGLWLSSIDSTTTEKLPVGDEAVSTFWSPDGRALGFISPDGQIRRLNLSALFKKSGVKKRARPPVSTHPRYAASGAGRHVRAGGRHPGQQPGGKGRQDNTDRLMMAHFQSASVTGQVTKNSHEKTGAVKS